MKHLALWMIVLCLTVLPGCSAEEPNVAATATPEIEAPTNTASPEPAGTVETETQTDSKPVQVAQADTPKPAMPERVSPFEAGRHYQILTPAQPTSSSPEQVEVAEAFMYGCPHCYSFEPFMQKWAPNKPENVKVVRIPVLFNRQAEVHARVYYTAEALGVLEETHLSFFKEIHVNRRPMTSEPDLIDFFKRYDVDAETFKKTFRSFDVEHKIRVAKTMAQRYRISSVPTVVVNGKYTSAGSNLAGNQLLALIDHLVDKESKR